jgi:hypothetical protein
MATAASGAGLASSVAPTLASTPVDPDPDGPLLNDDPELRPKVPEDAHAPDPAAVGADDPTSAPEAPCAEVGTGSAARLQALDKHTPIPSVVRAKPVRARFI